MIGPRRIYTCFQVNLPRPFNLKLWRKLKKPPAPWKRYGINAKYRTYVRFSAYFKLGDPSPPLEWVEEYMLLLALILV